MADVAGTREPIYGPTAILPVASQSTAPAFTELTRSDLSWAAMSSTCVETQTFYLTADNGHCGMAQVIYSNVGGLRTACQFNSKIFYPSSSSKPALWVSTLLSNHSFTPDHCSFSADSLDLTLSSSGDTYTIKSAVSATCLVNLTITRTAPGFHVGEDGKTLFGTDVSKPWGTMRHAFWPRATLSGSIITPDDGTIDFTGRAMFVHALQGMKPHHAAAKWDFVNVQTPTYSAVLMSYTTPPSYGNTLVSVGGIATDGRILCAGPTNTITHTAIATDPEKTWPEPRALRVEWASHSNTATLDSSTTNAVLSIHLPPRSDRVDVMAEVPSFVKAFVGTVSGARPHIYQFAVDEAQLSVKDGAADEVEEKGSLYYEATFISD